MMLTVSVRRAPQRLAGKGVPASVDAGQPAHKKPRIADKGPVLLLVSAILNRGAIDRLVGAVEHLKRTRMERIRKSLSELEILGGDPALRPVAQRGKQ